MTEIRQDLLDGLRETFFQQGVNAVSGEYDGAVGTLTFFFKDSSSESLKFEYPPIYANDPTSYYNESAFKTKLNQVGGEIIKAHLYVPPDAKLEQFFEQVTEQQ